MHKGYEAIRDWLYRQGYATRYSPKKWSIKVSTDNGVHLIKLKNTLGKGPMRQAIDFVESRIQRENYLEEVIKAISLNLKKQLKGQDIPIGELHDPYSWSAIGGSLNMREIAETAVNVIREEKEEAVI